ncbi:MAG TPA: amidohydrolase family protein [Myxococcota bacterium]|nr:amidohydrolase family protein [Myxococcota bacterium]
MLDLVIRNGLVVDGSGLPAFRGDLGIRDGRIRHVGGRLDGRARSEIDARGRVVAPGFIDPHTHFDAQILWDGQARPALEHGVTTVVHGNCSLSLAPLRAEHRPKLVKMFQQIEEMPDAAFDGAFEWTWEGFADYVAALRGKVAVNVAPLAGHSVIRLWTMGPDAQKRAATKDELTAMQDLLRDCLEAGAVGLSTSYVDVDENLFPVPSRFAHHEEVAALAEVLGEYGRMLQVVPEFYNTDITLARVDQLADLSLAHGIPTTFSPLFDSSLAPDNVTRILARVAEQFARGAQVWPQVQTRPIDISFSLDQASLYFVATPIWYMMLRLPREQRLAALRSDGTRKALVDAAEPRGDTRRFAHLRVRDSRDASLVGRTLGEIAEERGTTPAGAMLDLSLEEDLGVHFLAASMGHEDSSRIGPILANELVHVGASDAGAHIQSFATYGDTGYLFSEFVRKGGHLSLEHAVKKITGDTARIWNLPNRGLLRPGQAADVVVFDPDAIGRGAELPARDMPEGGMRYVRSASGVDTVVVNGRVTWSAAEGYTEERPGTLATL